MINLQESLREYFNNLIEDVISAAADYGENPSQRNENNLALTSETLYNAVNLVIPVKK